ncbi:MAG: M14 family metallocarboxypeptidase [Chloroflexi bacterium]|nr:M14 family metallocarboxypeptidase [Chloroflexota bacterium]
MQPPASYDEIVARVVAACDTPQLTLTRHPVDELGVDLLRVDIDAQGPALAHVGLFGGVHGDEPAGFMSVLEFLEERRWADHPRIAFSVFPCLNPTGCAQGTRENADGIDINRTYDRDEVPEVRVLRAMIEHDAFDAFIDAHEDPEEDGFYVYAFLEDRAWHPEIVQAVAERGPVTGKSEVDETPVSGGLISVGEDRSREEAFQEYMAGGDWPLPFYLYSLGMRSGMTTETPGQIELATRVAMQHAARERLLALLTAARRARA